MEIRDFENKKEELVRFFKSRCGRHGFEITKADENYGMAVLPFRNILSGPYELDTWQGELVAAGAEFKDYEVDVTRRIIEQSANGSVAFMLMAGEKRNSAIYIKSRRSDMPPKLVIERVSGLTEIYADNSAYISSKQADTPHYAVSDMPLKEDGEGRDAVGRDTSRVYLKFPLDKTDTADIVSARLTVCASAPGGRGTVLVINNGDTSWREQSLKWSAVGGNMYSFENVPAPAWSVAPEFADSEYNNVSARFWFARPMVYEYLSYLKNPAEYKLTHPYSDRYPGSDFAQRLIDLMSAFASQTEYGWPRTLETGERLSRWTDVIAALLPEGEFDGRADDFYNIISYMYGECEHLAGLDITDDSVWWSNWRIVANAGFFKAAELFEGFSEYDTFRARAEANVIHTMNLLYNDDMSFREAAPAYALWCASLFGDCAAAALKCGRALGDAFMQRLGGAARYAAASFYPGGFDSNIGDSNYRDKSAEFARLAELTGDELLAAYVNNDDGYKKHLTVVYPAAGSAFMRTGWNKDEDIYLSFINNPFDGHCHPDSNQVLLYAYGSPLLVDSGRYSYSGTSDIYARLRTAAAHNTIEADGMEPECHSKAKGELVSSENGMFTYVSSVNSGYTGVKHKRCVLFFRSRAMHAVVFDKVEGDKPRIYRQNWHFMPSSNAAVSGNAVITDFYKSANIAVMSDGADVSVKPDWFSADYGLAAESLYASFEKRGRNVSFVTVLNPLRAGQKNTLSVSAVSKMSICVKDSGSIQYGFDGDFGKYTTDAAAAFVGTRGGTAYGLAFGTRLAGAVEYISSKTEISSVGVRLTEKRAEIFADGAVKASLYAPNVEKVFLNGKPIFFSRNGEYIDINTFL